MDARPAELSAELDAIEALFGPNWYNRCKRIALNMTSQMPLDREEVGDAAIERFWCKWRSLLESKTSASTDLTPAFATQVFKNCVRDIVREQRGRVRAPDSVKGLNETLGGRAEQIYLDHVLEGLSREQLSEKHGVDSDKVTLVLKCISTRQPPMLHDQRMVSEADISEGGMEDFDSASPSSEASYDLQFQQNLLQEVTASLKLTSDERLVIQLRYSHHMSATQAADMLPHLSVSQVRRMEKRVLKQFRKQLGELGYSAEDFLG